MQFSLLLGLLCALLATEFAPAAPARGVFGQLIGVTMIAGVTPLYALFVCRLRLAEQALGNRCNASRFSSQQWRAMFEWVWLASVVGLAFGTSWCQVVRENWHLRHWVLIDELLILVPVFAPLVVAWWILQNVGVRHASMPADLGFGTRVAKLTRDFAQLGRDHLLILLAPVLALIAVRDVVDVVSPSFQAGTRAWLLYGPLLGAMFCGLPLLLRYVWQTTSLPPGPLRSRLEDAARVAGVRLKHILVWHTGDSIANAAVTGVNPKLRLVFLTDRLLRHLSEREIEAVFLHELGHIRHRHLMVRASAVLLPVCLWAAFIPEGLLTASVTSTVAMLLLVVAYGWWVFGALSQRLERQADLFACRQLAAGTAWQQNRTDLSDAIALYSNALRRLSVLNGIDLTRKTWQHGRVSDRLDWLSEMRDNPRKAQRFQWQLRVTGSLVMGFIVGLVAHLIAVASVWASS